VERDPAEAMLGVESAQLTQAARRTPASFECRIDFSFELMSESCIAVGAGPLDANHDHSSPQPLSYLRRTNATRALQTSAMSFRQCVAANLSVGFRLSDSATAQLAQAWFEVLLTLLRDSARLSRSVATINKVHELVAEQASTGDDALNASREQKCRDTMS
jgi:hypothetical protein